MHRCIYGLVHPDDHYDVKSTLESSLQTEQVLYILRYQNNKAINDLEVKAVFKKHV